MKIYIADDDIILVKGLRAIIERNCSYCEVIGEGHNGLEALEDMKHLQPDLLITDIKMPVMDGVELVKRVKDIFSNMKVIVISGYDEYSYIRETLKHGAVDYLLKPVENDDLLGLINKIKDDIGKENENRRKMILFNERINESLVTLKEKVLLDLIKGNGKNPQEIEIKLHEYGIKVMGIYTMAFIVIDEYYPKNVNCFTAKDPSVISMVIEKCLANEENRIEVLETYMESAAVVLFIGDESNEKCFSSTVLFRLEAIRMVLEKEYSFSITVGVSKIFYCLDKAHIGFEQSKLASERKFYEGKNKLIDYNPESCCYNYFDVKNLNLLLTELVRDIEICDNKGSKKTIIRIFERMKQDNIQPEQFKEIWAYVINRISNLSQEFNEATKQYSLYGNDLLVCTKRIDTLEELIEYMVNAILGIIDKIDLMRFERGKKIIEKSKEYIRNHFKEDISLTDLANHVYLNASYLSDLFKKETGQNFTNFLMEMRINEAKKLLGMSGVKVYEVGRMVGYDEPVSFSRAFKRVVGISPHDYKKI